MERVKTKTVQPLISVRKKKLELKELLFQKMVPKHKLPTLEHPKVFCYLTRRQAAAIPKDQYVVQRVASVRPIKKGRSQEEKDAYMIELTAALLKSLKERRDAERKKSRRRRVGGGGGGTPPSSNVFIRFIDEDEMSDCILRIIEGFFHGEEKCTIREVELNLYEFSLLMHFYFDYIKILAKDSQLAYCTYLKNKVFSGEDRVKVRNFNIYARKSIYSKFKKLLEKDKSISFTDSSTTTPSPMKVLLQPEKKLIPPFQKIGRRFHFSSYFKKLRNERENLEDINL